jgi:NTE family protein
MIAWQLRHELETVPTNIDVHIVPTLCPLAVSPFDFSASRSLIERAVQSTRRWIDSGGLARRSGPEELAPHDH